MQSMIIEGNEVKVDQQSQSDSIGEYGEQDLLSDDSVYSAYGNNQDYRG